jgi:hypothetical protein
MTNEQGFGGGNTPEGGNGAAESDLRHRMGDLAQGAGAQIEHARMLLDDLNQRALAFIRERPGTALLGALALGFVVGKLAQRSGR